MAFPDITAALRKAMPDLRGTLAANVPLAPLTWFKTGGPAQVLFEPADEADLACFLQRLDASHEVLALGAGSNLLLRDGGFAGVAIRLGEGFEKIAIDGLDVAAGASARDMKVALHAARAGVGGLSFLRGIPGSIGGALRMNAGAYGSETRDRLVSCRGIDRAGKHRHLLQRRHGLFLPPQRRRPRHHLHSCDISPASPAIRRRSPPR